MAFWAVISLLLLWLCLLALSDILQTRHRWRVLQRDVQEELRQALEEAIGSTAGNSSVIGTESGVSR